MTTATTKAPPTPDKAGTIGFSMRLPAAQHELLRRESAKRGNCGLASVVRSAIEAYFDAEYANSGGRRHFEQEVQR
jgi:hypothetical protein